VFIDGCEMENCEVKLEGVAQTTSFVHVVIEFSEVQVRFVKSFNASQLGPAQVMDT